MLNSTIQNNYQYSLFNNFKIGHKNPVFPSTRYQGSKYKLIDWNTYAKNITKNAHIIKIKLAFNICDIVESRGKSKPLIELSPK